MLGPFFMAVHILDSWLPRIGDYSIAGWVICLGYLLAAILCHVAFKHATNHILRCFWLALGMVCLFLSINKQLDLQTLLTIAGRHIVQYFGWFAERRVLQKTFVMLFAMFSLAGLLLCSWLVRLLPMAERLALAGALVLGSFVFIRAAAIHHVALFGNPMIAHLVPALLECTGIALVVAGALFRLKKYRSTN